MKWNFSSIKCIGVKRIKMHNIIVDFINIIIFIDWYTWYHLILFKQRTYKCAAFFQLFNLLKNWGLNFLVCYVIVWLVYCWLDFQNRAQICVIETLTAHIFEVHIQQPRIKYETVSIFFCRNLTSKIYTFSK